MLKRQLNIKGNSQASGNSLKRKAIKTYRTGIYLSALLMISACGNDGIGDLKGFVAKIKAETPGKVEPLPELKPFEKYTYSAYLEELKDPFVTWETINPKIDHSRKSGGIAGGVLPDGSRQRETLESYPLETLTMMGTLEYENENWGLIKAPDGIVYRVRRGNYIGQNHGKVSMVDSDSISLVEIISDGLGGWKNRPAGLSLNNE